MMTVSGHLSAMLNAIIALRCLGYSEDDPQVIARATNLKSSASNSRHARNAGADFPHDALHESGMGHGAGVYTLARRACRGPIRA